ncbi:hypothetical protein [Aureimonas psammosilenae]|uniref:hypothetical protein n=1 Tax=Aureimonas psammosilenae TaxID=2495496 RepID=UPI0012611702|nr:hypothetical protein [Aureimonas psammosilenae]
MRDLRSGEEDIDQQFLCELGAAAKGLTLVQGWGRGANLRRLFEDVVRSRAESEPDLRKSNPFPR